VGFVFRIVHTWGKLDSLGYNAENVADGGLNSPYDAKKPWATIRGLRRRFDEVSLGGRGPVPHPVPDFLATVGCGRGLRSPAMESALCSAVWL
jgi:hypothetical protein